MDIDRDAISSHMLDLGLGALAHATHHAMYHSMNNNRWPELSILQAAHAAEILIKARISQEHPLLIFDKLPRNRGVEAHLDFSSLYEQGRTFQYNALPDQLWATTGIKIPNRNEYDDFGKVRNNIQHFLPENRLDYSSIALKFIYKVIDPFIHESWGLYAADYYEDPDGAEHLIPALIKYGIRFLVSPDMAQNWEYAEIVWSENDPEYKDEMERRLLEAQSSIA